MIQSRDHLVTAITRSFGRLPFLRRAAESILSQKCNQLIWLIVNNGGERTSVESIADWARQHGATVQVVHLDQPVGIWNAANAGVQAAETPFLILHDDDDSWSPEFLARTMGFLQANEHFAGVSTQCTCIHEDVVEGTITETNRFVLNADFQSCQLGDMAVLSRIVPIAFLYRASLHQDVGWFSGDLPVMGDWEFCLRALTRHEIGVIPEPLANYHHRAAISDVNDPNGNTVIAKGNIHAMADAMIRNGLFREDLIKGSFGLGSMLTLARSMLRSQELDRFSLYAVRDEVAQRLSDLETLLKMQQEQNDALLRALDSIKGQIGARLDELTINQLKGVEELRHFSNSLHSVSDSGIEVRGRLQLIEERLAQGWLARMRNSHA